MDKDTYKRYRTHGVHQYTPRGEIIVPIYGWKPRPHQLDAWNAKLSNQYDEMYLAWHRRAGKDEFALQATAVDVMSRVGNYWHTLPEIEQARKAIWNGINPHTGRRRWQDAFPIEAIDDIRDNDMFIRFKNGSTWQLIGSDRYNNLLSASAVGIVFSEAALCDPRSISILRPMVLENGGKSMYISSVRGDNHFHKMFKLAMSDPRAYTSHLSALNSGVFTPEQLEKERRKMIALNGEALGDLTFRQEYLSEWNTGEVGSVFSSEITKLVEENRKTKVMYDRHYPVHTFWDLGVRDNTVIIFAQFIGNAIHIINCYTNTEIGLNQYVATLKRFEKEYGYLYGYHFAPHDIKHREFSSGVSRIDEAKRLGVVFKPVAKIDKRDQIACGSNVFDRCFFDETNCEQLVNMLSRYKFTYNSKTQTVSKAPKHDDTSHFADAFMLMAVVVCIDAQKPLSQKLLQKSLYDIYNRQIVKFNDRAMNNNQLSYNAW